MNITQELGFDVSQALTSLNRLDKAIDKHIGRIGALQTAYNGLNSNALGQVAAATNRLANASNNLGQVQQAANRANASLQQFGTQSGQTLSGLVRRVTAANLLSRGIANTTSALSDAVGSAIDFQRSLSEIQTIAPQLQGDFDGLASRVRSLSDAYNAQLGDVSEGLYQTISNQVQGTSNQFDVLSTSLKFSKAAVTTTEQSVQLLTAALNGFGISASRSEDVAAKFFKTIELGRTRASELSNSIGRVAKIADQTGVSLEEVQAAIATITISGVKTSEAITQLRGVFTGLLKPTTDMEQALQRVGFTSAEQAVQILGFKGTLDALVESTGGSVEALAELFPRVRGLSGVLNIASKDATKFEENLRKIEATTAKTLNDAYQIVIETDAERVTKELNTLKNFLTEEFGNAVLGAGSTLIDLTGGTENFKGALAGLIGSLGGAAGALGTYAASAALASRASAAGLANVSKFARGLGGVGSAVFLGLAAIDAYNASVERGLRDYSEKLDRQLDESLRKIRESNAAQIASEQEKWRRVERTAADSLRTQIADFNDAQQKIQRANALYATSLGAAIEKTLQGRQGAVEALFERSDEARKQSLDAANASASIQTRTEDLLFNRTTSRLSLQEQFNRTLSRSASLGQEAEKALRSARTTDDRTAAASLFDRAQSLEKQAASLASQLGDTTSLNRSNTLLLSLTKQRTSALEAYGKKQDSIASKAEKQGRVERERLSILKQRFSEIAESAKLFDENGQILPEGQRLRNAQTLIEDLSQFQREAGRFVDLETLIDVEQLKRETQRSLTGLEVKSLNFKHSAFSDLERRLQSSIDNVFADKRVELIVDLIFERTGKKVTSTDGIISGLEDLAGTRETLGQLDSTFEVAFSKATLSAENLISKLSQAEDQFDGLAGAGNALVRGGSRFLSALGEVADRSLGGEGIGLDPNEYLKRAQNISDRLKTIAANDLTLITPDLIKSYREQIEDLQNRTFNGVPESYLNSLDRAVSGLDEIRQSLEEARKASAEFDAIQFDDKFNSGVDGLQKQLDALNVDRLRESLEGLKKTANEVGAALNTGISGAATQIASATTQMQALAAAARSVQVPIASAADPQFRAAGGAVRGRDNVLTSLSAGERVINARNSRRFATDLIALNAGVQPTYRENGGVVVNVGDVNVNSPSPETAARSIGRGLRREIQQGLLRL